MRRGYRTPATHVQLPGCIRHTSALLLVWTAYYSALHRACWQDCSAEPKCCVNQHEGVAYFFVGSHWAPRLPLTWTATIDHMRRSRFCLCPGGDTPYTKRFFLALLSGCIPVVFTFPSRDTSGDGGAHSASPDAGKSVGVNWWSHNGPPLDDAFPFSDRIAYRDLVVEIPSAMVVGFVEVLRRVPHALMEEKQRRIEAVRHLLLYDPTGSGEDAFTMVLRELIRRLV